MQLRLAPLSAAFALTLLASTAHAQTSFGTSCAGASGVTPELTVTGVVQSGQPWTLTVTAPGGIGLGYLLVGFSNTSASALGGVTLPLDLGAFFADPLWGGCELAIDPSYLLMPYTFDPNSNGGTWSKNFPGFDDGVLFLQALNIDPDFTTRIAGVSRGAIVGGDNLLTTGLRLIPSGTFTMGSLATGAPYLAGADEAPHTVTISHSFWMGQHEVTQAQYESVMGSNPSLFVGPNLPVESVAWSDAVAYCQALTTIESAAGNVPSGYEYRLPTEAEWEYACRAGTTTEFSIGTGTDLPCGASAVSHSLQPSTPCGYFGAVPVGSFAPNAWGLFDVHGNVSEWCIDTYGTYPTSRSTDPVATGGSSRVHRGGSWLNPAFASRSATRYSSSPTQSDSTRGFRVVLAPLLTP